MASNLDTRQLENVCRLCLTDASEAGHMLPIFPVRGGNPNNPTSMVNRIFQCTSLKLEPKEGIPATICELCSVRLEDWFAFREQCLGSDEYLRVALAHAYCADSQTPQTISQFASQQHQRPVVSFSAETVSRAAPLISNSSEVSQPRSSSLAKRRKSTFELPLGDGKGNTTDQKVIVEVLEDGCPKSSEQSTGGQRDGNQASYEPIPLMETDERTPHAIPGTPIGAVLPENVVGLLEEATWSKEYCARVNSLMVLVNGSRPYKCKICRKLFKSRSNLRRHIKVGHSDEVFEGESPPPECYDFGHIHRSGGAVQPQIEDTLSSVQHQQFQEQQHQQNQQQQTLQQQVFPQSNLHSNGGVPVKRKRRSNNDPPIVGPHACQLCPRSFKMAAHLAVHMKTHQRVAVAPPSGLELQVQQQLLQRQRQQRESIAINRHSTSRKTDIEPSAIIQLSDDDEDDVAGEDKAQVQPHQMKSDDCRSPGQADELDDGFDEEEGSLKEVGALVEPANTDLATCSLAAVPKRLKQDDDDEVVIQNVPPVETQPKPRRIPAPGTIPPGPLSMKQRYRASMESGRIPGPEPHSQQQFPFIVARPKHSPVTVASSTPPPPLLAQSSAVETSMAPGPQSSGSLPTVTVHRCHFCQQTFSREDLLRLHQKTHQRDAPFPFRCRWCQKGFRYRQNYTLHVEKQTCRLLNGDGGSVPQPPGAKMVLAAPVARPIVANKRAW